MNFGPYCPAQHRASNRITHAPRKWSLLQWTKTSGHPLSLSPLWRWATWTVTGLHHSQNHDNQINNSIEYRIFYIARETNKDGNFDCKTVAFTSTHIYSLRPVDNFLSAACACLYRADNMAWLKRTRLWLPWGPHQVSLCNKLGMRRDYAHMKAHCSRAQTLGLQALIRYSFWHTALSHIHSV